MSADAFAIATDVAAQLTAAWNAANGERYGALFTADAGFIDIRGDLHRSRVAIGRGHQAIFDTIYRGSSVSYVVVSAITLGTVVVAQMRVDMNAPGAPLPPNDGSMATAVLVDDGGVWRIAAFHNTLRLRQ